MKAARLALMGSIRATRPEPRRENPVMLLLAVLSIPVIPAAGALLAIGWGLA